MKTQTRCPICNQSNECTANSNIECWCFTQSIPTELIDQANAENKDPKCICRQCVTSYLERHSNGSDEFQTK